MLFEYFWWTAIVKPMLFEYFWWTGIVKPMLFERFWWTGIVKPMLLNTLGGHDAPTRCVRLFFGASTRRETALPANRPIAGAELRRVDAP